MSVWLAAPVALAVMDDRARPVLVMLGPDPRARGRIASVLRIWHEAGLLAGSGRQVLHLPTHVDGGTILKLLSFVGALLRFCGLLLVGRVAVVHAHSGSEAGVWRGSLFLALARLAGRPYVLHLHGGTFECQQAGASGFARAWLAHTVRRAGIVLVPSENQASRLREAIDHPDVRVLPCPVLPAQLPADVAREPQTLLFLGRLDETGGIFVLIKALARLAGVRPGLHAILAGEGDVARVRAAAAAAGIAERITLPGRVAGEARGALLARAGVFVLPSCVETASTALLEAQAAGLPVVATRVGGILQMVSDRQNGMLAEPDDVASLVSALKPMLDDAVQARRMGEAGRRRVLDDYGVERVRGLLEAAWGQLDGRPPPGG